MQVTVPNVPKVFHSFMFLFQLMSEGLNIVSVARSVSRIYRYSYGIKVLKGVWKLDM